MSRKELKSLAKQQLKGRWGKAVLVTLLFMVITIVLQLIYTLGIVPTESVILSVIGYLALIVILCVLSYGLSKYALNFTDSEKTPKAGDLFSLAPIALKVIGLNLLVGLIVIVGTILLVIPGIIAALALSQVSFILAEDPSKSITQCIKESYRMMKGHKWQYFVLGLSFIGWVLLTIPTIYIGLLWLYPYMMITYANYYLKIKGQAQETIVE